jgi:hypothetical protein
VGALGGVLADQRQLGSDEGARKARGEVNVPPPSPGRSYRQIILGNIFSFANQVTAGARAERRVLTPLQREINGMIRLTLLVVAFLMVVLTIGIAT